MTKPPGYCLLSWDLPSVDPGDRYADLRKAVKGCRSRQGVDSHIHSPLTTTGMAYDLILL